MAAAEPRRKQSIWLIGLILGPVVLMLWLGRGRLAIFYLLAQLIFGGLFFLAVAAGVIAPFGMVDFGTMAFLLNLPLNIVGLIHGVKIRETSLQRPWFSRWYAAIVLAIALGLIPFPVRMFLYQPFNIPSGAMYPTLRVGDYLFVSKLSYGYSKYSFNFSLNAFGLELFKFGPIPAEGRFFFAAEPQRGDVVVFKLPRDNETDYIKRVVGLPGDRIQLKQGIVYLNGEALKLTPVQGIPCLEGESCNYLRETLPDGRSYVINDANPNGAADNTAEYVVPTGHYFMLGDNRDNSLDSRFAENAPGGGVGFVPYDNLIGPAVLIFWNSFGIRVDDRLQGYPGK